MSIHWNNELQRHRFQIIFFLVDILNNFYHTIQIKNNLLCHKSNNCDVWVYLFIISCHEH